MSVRAHYYDYKTDKDVEFSSSQPHCESCLEDKELGYVFPGCCCVHQMEYALETEDER